MGSRGNSIETFSKEAVGNLGKSEKIFPNLPNFENGQLKHVPKELLFVA